MTHSPEQPSKMIAGALAMVFPAFGLHWFYLGNKKNGVICLVLAFAFSWTLIIPLCLVVVEFWRGVWWLFMSPEKWEAYVAAQRSAVALASV